MPKLTSNEWFTYQARANEVEIVSTEESSWIGGEDLGVARDDRRVAAAHAKLQVVAFEDADHVDETSPCVVPDQQVCVAGEEFDQSRTGTRTSHMVELGTGIAPTKGSC